VKWCRQEEGEGAAIASQKFFIFLFQSNLLLSVDIYKYATSFPGLFRREWKNLGKDVGMIAKLFKTKQNKN